MCGIVGLLYKERHSGLEKRMQDIAILGKMLKTPKHRGPDEHRIVEFGNVILGHTRLSIIDLEGGSQPIYNEKKNVAVVLNGEIYNFQELRKDLILKGHIFRTKSDTEVLVHLYEEVGEDLFGYLNGMFAMILYDKRKKILLAGRDRIGEKPLLYWSTREKIVFASELKAIIQHPEFRKEIDLNALSFYFNCMYIPAPFTIFRGGKKTSSCSLYKGGRRAGRYQVLLGPES